MQRVQILSITFLLLLTSQLFGQKFPRKDYDWEANRKTPYVITDEEKKGPAVIIKDSRYFDYVESNDPDKGFDLYVTKHKIVHVNDDKGIDRFNKVYIPTERGDEVVQLKARTISKNGTVTEVNKDNIKDVSNYEQYGNYKIFALENVEKDGELEYFFTLRKGADSYNVEIFQNDMKVKNASFTLTTPSYLVFEPKSYFGFPTLKEETKDSVLTLSGSASEIPAMIDEQYSTSSSNRMKVCYKLSYNRRVSEEKLVTWNSAAARYYSLLHPKDMKKNKVEKLVKQLKLQKMSPDEQVKTVEKYLKENITYKKVAGEELSDPNTILETKLANEIGLTKLYIAIFDEISLPVYAVMTGNRYESKFDPDFVDYSNFDEIILYFPVAQKYLSPIRLDYRYGIAPQHLADNYALFIKGPFSGVAKMLPILGYEDNKSLLDAEITFPADMESAIVNKTQQWTGYRAIQLRAVYEYSDPDSKNELLKQYTTSGIEDAKVITRTVENMKIDDGYGEAIATVKTNYKAASLMENAGNNYLLNIGKLIGTQSELYQEKERMNDIEMESPNQYKHHIYFKIPKGYKVKGLDDVNIDKSLVENGKRVCQFLSSYTLKDNMVDINVHEFYKSNHFPKARYEDFRKVINAASDFNKLVLVLEKE